MDVVVIKQTTIPFFERLREASKFTPNAIPSGYPHKFYGKNTADKVLMAAEKIFVTIRDFFIENGGEDIVETDDN